MTDTDPAGFGQFIPGYDFLKQLGTQAGALPGGMPGFGAWGMPTLKPEELEKRIQELRAVHFWLEQNVRAIAATIQALEVQKMTLDTLRGMNVNLEEAMAAFQVHPGKAQAESPPAAKNPPAAGPDPMQWWNGLTQQFQAIAGHALRDMAVTAPQAPQPVAGKRSRGAGTAGSPKAARAPAAKSRSTSRRKPGG